MLSIQKARSNWQAIGTRTVARVPEIFRPAVGGSAYFGRSYRWQQVMHYKFWSFVAIKAWIREIAGGEAPKSGTLSTKVDPKRRSIRKSLGGPKQHHQFEPYEDDDPMVRVFERPNDNDVAYDLWAYTTLFHGLTGSAHWWVRRNGFGIPKEIWVIPTHWMQLENDADGMPYRYFVQSPWGHMQYIPFNEVVSFYEHSPLEPRYGGWAVSQAIAEWIDSYESLIRMRLAVWKNGAVPSYHMKLGESFQDPDDQFLARFYSKLFSRFQGEDKSGLPIVTGSDVEILPIEGHRPADALAASNESEIQIRDQTLAAYGVPKAIVGLVEHGSWSGVEAEKDAFRQFAVNSLLTYMGQIITEKVVRVTPGYEKGTFYWEDRVTGDADFKLREQEMHLDRGVITIAEARAADGREAYPLGGSNPMISGVEMPWVKPIAAQADDELLSEGGPSIPSMPGASGGGDTIVSEPAEPSTPEPGPDEPPVQTSYRPRRLRGMGESGGSVGGYLVNGRR